MLLLPEGRAGEAWKYSENIAIPETGEHWTVKYWHFLHSKPHALLRREDLTSQLFHNTKSNLVFSLNTEKDLS
jgi:hypothetical protein